MQTAVTIFLAILLPGALIVGLIVWRERRKAAAQARRDATAVAWDETAQEGTEQQAQRPIWRPGNQK